jgi:DNA polymerase-1
MKVDALLLDAKNSLYRAIYAGHSDKAFMSSGHDYLVVLFRFLHRYFTLFGPSSVHVFWDTPSSRIWRKALFEDYKGGRDPNKRDFDADTELKRCTKKAMMLFQSMGFYQYQRDGIEADDLIYAFCKIYSRRKDYKTVIISSDGDFVQVPYAFDNVVLYNPLNKKNDGMVEIPDDDPVEMKAFIGDNSDNVPGYYGIGPVKATRLVRDPEKKRKFLEENGTEIFYRNRRIIDLSLCPEMADNIFYVEQVLSESPSFNDGAAKKLAYKIRGLLSEYDRIISPFKFIAEEQQK